MMTHVVQRGGDGADAGAGLAGVLVRAGRARRRTSSTCCPASAPAFSRSALPVAYAIAVLFLEPFYVAAGFAMYLNRRAELEAWDIEQEFRRAFAH